LIKAE